MKVLNLGAGRFGSARIHMEEAEVISLDADPELRPDLLCTLGRDPIPLPDSSVDIVVACHVLEHVGRQGETKEWFQCFEEIYRVLKPDGLLDFESPFYTSVWAWGDPSHTRVVLPQSFIFFHQESYRIPDSAISPFRIRCDFVPLTFELHPGDEDLQKIEQVSYLRGRLKAIKPLNPWWEDAA